MHGVGSADTDKEWFVERHVLEEITKARVVPQLTKHVG
jgi:hypothetical protein